jgi:hypothetical protein
MIKNKLSFFILIIPVIISFLLLAAHFYRRGNLIFTIIAICIPFLLFLKNKYSIYIVQIFLFAGIIVWINTYVFLKNIYDKYNVSFSKAGLILSCVILLTALSILILNFKPLKNIYVKK